MQGMQRLFFGLEVDSPWPSFYPEGRLISEKQRHITLAFLGFVDPTALQKSIEKIPLPSFSIGPVGFCDQLLFLPEERPRTVSWHIEWLSEERELSGYRVELLHWLDKLGYRTDRRPFLPHLTIARTPFKREEWEGFSSQPFITKALHLYESIGNLHYPSRWQFPLEPAFEEFEHTADLAFSVRASNLQQLYLHAALALSFKFPPLIAYLKRPNNKTIGDFFDVISALNELIAVADQEQGCPFKAVSYHGQFKENSWEMIVDV